MSNRKPYSTSVYHTYEESLKICRSSSSFLRYIRERKDDYYHLGDFDSVDRSLGYITDSIYDERNMEDEREILDRIGSTIEGVFSIVGEDGEKVTLFRGVRLKDESCMDWNDLGKCWTVSEETASGFLDRWVDASEGDKYIIECSTSVDNVDWILSICLRLTHTEEDEIRVYDTWEMYEESIHRCMDLYR